LQRSNRFLTDGRDAAQGAYDQSYETSQDYIDPYIESGQRGQGAYDDLMGLNGPEARAAAQEKYYSSNPAMMGQLGQQQNAMMRAMNARGSSYSGAGALAAERVSQQNYGQFMDRFNNRAQQGFGAAQAGAGNANQYGNNTAQLQYGYGQQRAGNEISASNAISQTRNTGMNNMLGIAGLGLQGYGAYNSRPR
jgi:hypothetical protein